MSKVIDLRQNKEIGWFGHALIVAGEFAIIAGFFSAILLGMFIFS